MFLAENQTFFSYINLMLYMRYISEEKCIVGRRHLACKHELAEGEHSFCAQCESTVRLRFASPFRISSSVKWP